MTFLDNIEQIITLYPLVAFGAVFLAGVISSASPCVLATIPLVVGFVGGYSDGDRSKAFRYSLMFIFGLSLTFTAFGAAAGLLGTMFGTLGGPWYLIAGVIALVMGGQLMGIYEIRRPIMRDFKPKRGGHCRSLSAGIVLRGCLFSLRYAGAGGSVDAGCRKRTGALWHLAAVLLRHRSLPADALCRNLYRFCRRVRKGAGCGQLFYLGKAGQRIGSGVGGGLVCVVRLTLTR